MATGFPLVAIRSFIQATRDSGYKSTSAAVSELVDNAFEAEATCVRVDVDEDLSGEKRLSVSDNGHGMPPAIMQLALQFGGSTRFDHRQGTGRYGMGLPNGSLSQARRVDLYSWSNPHKIWSTYLDVDEIASGALEGVPSPIRFKPGSSEDYPESPSGTVVELSKCDKLDYRTVKAQAKRLHLDLGRIFRQRLYQGKQILVNGEAVAPSDPTFLHPNANLCGAEPYGPPLEYEVRPPFPVAGQPISKIHVRFVLLPIEKWHSLSNENKNQFGISGGAGVSIIRAGREIDYGWYFMGGKRRENYDDWWRCEVCFGPVLDELFGVTHTKQKINPTVELNEILVPDLERVARELNAIVRKRYTEVRAGEFVGKAVATAEQRDVLMEPLPLRRSTEVAAALGRKLWPKVDYAIEYKRLEEVSFYIPALGRNKLLLTLNQEHSFFRKIYEPLFAENHGALKSLLGHLQLLLFSIARAECNLRSRQDRDAVKRLREEWSNALTAYLD
jgi:hypothetical protein